MEVDVDAADIEAETDNVGKRSRQPGSLIVGAIAACRPEEHRLRRLSRAAASRTRW